MLLQGANNCIKIQIARKCNKTEVKTPYDVFFQETHVDCKPKMAAGQLEVQMPPE